MGNVLSYYLGLISVGAPAGLAIYHYCLKDKNGQTATSQQNCCCTKEKKDCSDVCTEDCK